jgi:hypothetical protein
MRDSQGNNYSLERAFLYSVAQEAQDLKGLEGSVEGLRTLDNTKAILLEQFLAFMNGGESGYFPERFTAWGLYIDKFLKRRYATQEV